MNASRTTIASALVLALCPVTTPRLLADPPAISESEVEAYLAQYRAEMSRIHQREQLRQEQAETQLHNERLCREQEASILAIVARADDQDLAERAEFGSIEFDFTAVPTHDISFGMLSPQTAEDQKPAAPAKSAASHSDLAAQATNPVAPLIQLQFQNTFVIESNTGSGYSNQFTIQPVIPWKIGDQPIISRLTMPLIATADLGDPIDREYGLGDLVVINFATWSVGKGGPWQGMIGAGPAFTFPSASSDFTGQGKWQAGPGFLYINSATKGLQWGFMAYQQWSFASGGGDSGRDEVSTMFFQPILNFHFGDGWYAGTGDMLMSIDWNSGADWSVPLSARLGKVTTIFGNQKANIFVEPFYDISGNNSGNEWGIKLSVSLLFPTG